MKALLVAFAAVVALLCAFAVTSTSAAICQVGQTPNTLCLCANDAATQDKCNSVWFMCEQQGTAKIRNLGIVFGAAAQQPDSVRTKDRWTIANTGNYYSTFGSDSSKPNPVTFSTSTAWFNNGVGTRPVSTNYPFGQNMRACTADNLLVRNGDSDLAAINPTCQSGLTPCQYRLYSAEWAVLEIAVQTSAASYKKVDPTNGKWYTTSANGIAGLSYSTPLYSIGGVTGSDASGTINVQCYVSLQDPCQEGDCKSSNADVIVTNEECCDASTVRWDQPEIDCCPAGFSQTGSNTVCCPTDKTYRQCETAACKGSQSAAVVDSNNQKICCPAGNYLNINGGDCCPSELIVSGQCCRTGTVVGNVCCPSGRVTTPIGESSPRCCPDGQPSGTLSGNYYWISGGCCPENRANADQSYCCPASGTVATSVSYTSADRRCCPADNVNFNYDGTRNGNTASKACCPAVDLYRTHAAEDGTAQTRDCCPQGRVLTDGDRKYCCAAAVVAGMRWVRDASSGKDICCPGNRYKSCDGVSRCCPDASAVCTSRNSPCCPPSNVVNDASGTPQCCPNPGSGMPGLSEVPYVWLREGQCCPTAWVSGSTCCPGPVPASYQSTDGNACCPTARVLTHDSRKYCCPSGRQASQSTWTENDNCCPTNQVATYRGEAICCPGTTGAGGEYRVTNNSACCRADRVVSNYCCDSGSDRWTPEDPCCDSSDQITFSGVVHCCRARSASGSVWLPSIGDCCSERLALGTVCCPNQFVSDVRSGGPYESGVYDPNRVSRGGIYCCPTANIEQGGGRKYCCPAPTDTYVNEDSRCCPANNLAFPYCANAAASCACNDRNNKDCIRCCPSFAASLPTGSTFWTTTSDEACCPNGRINKAPATGAYASPPRCCPNPNSWRVDVTTSGGSERQACCPLDRILKEAGKYYCCPTDNQYYIEGGFNNNNPGFKWASSWCCPNANVKSGPDGQSHCCPAGAFTITLLGDSASMRAIANGADRNCCPTPQVITVPEGPYCCPPTGGPPGTTATTNRAGWTLGKEASGLTRSGPRPSDPETCCPPAYLLTTPVTLSDGKTLRVCCPSLAAEVEYLDATAPCCPTATVTVDPDTGKKRCCPEADQVYTPNEKCCPAARANSDRSVCCPAGVVEPQATVNEPCCPKARTFTDSDGELHCCPTGQVWDTTGEPEKCCPGVRNDVGLGCCPAAGRVNTTNDVCCPPERVAYGNECCPDERFNPSLNFCCSAQSLFVDEQCCALNFLDKWNTTCCNLPGMVLDPYLNCCPDNQLSEEGICCPPEVRDWTGACCPLDAFIANSSFDANANVIINNRSCCYALDCAGVCETLDGQAMHSVDANGVCCPASERDCAGMCLREDSTPINVADAGGCCPQGPPHRDCYGVCGGKDLYCCEVISNCSGCIAQSGCGWCTPPLSPNGQCMSGSVHGPNGATCSYSWLYDTDAGVLSRYGEFGPNGNPPHIEPKHQVVLLTPGTPVTTTIRVRAPTNLPLDIFLLQDVSNSFVEDLPNLKASVQALVDNVTAFSPNTHFGWASFIDKPIAPFGFWSIYGGLQDYECKLELPLTGNYLSFVNDIQNLTTTGLGGGADVPEATLDCMMMFAQDPAVGWREDAEEGTQVNRLMIIVSDAPFHEAGDIEKFADPNNALADPPPWKPNDGDATIDSAVREGVNDPARCCLGEDYASVAQVITALNNRVVTPIFAIAQIFDATPPYTADSGLEAWEGFRTQLAESRNVDVVGAVVELDQYSLTLVTAVVSALKSVTQTVSLGETTVPASPFLVDIQPPTQNAPQGTIVNFTLTLLWDPSSNKSYPSVEQNSISSHNISLKAFFPLTNIVFENATVEVIMAPPPICGYCGDGITDVAIGEQCDYAEENPTAYDGRCCTSDCYFRVNEGCDDADACYPKICSDTGACVTAAVNCSDVAPEEFFCSFNRCIGGECVWQCTSDECCEDNDNCTINTCLKSTCKKTLLRECDCRYVTDCIECVQMERVRCAYDLSGACFSFNETIFTQTPDFYGPRHPVYDEETIKTYCVPKRNKGNKTGAIVGGVLGGLAGVAALAALGVVLYTKLAAGGPPAAGAGAPGAGAAAGSNENPIYQQSTTAENPLWSG